MNHSKNISSMVSVLSGTPSGCDDLAARSAMTISDPKLSLNTSPTTVKDSPLRACS